MTDAKRKQIKDKVEAGEARVQAREDASLADRAGDKALEAKDKFTAFAKEHPITTVAGALALGVLISGLFPRSPTRKAANKVGTRAASLAAIGAELAMAYAQQAMDAAGEAGKYGAEKLDDLGDSVGDTARSLSRGAGRYAGSAADSARAAALEARNSLRKTIRKRMN